jgi:hypothetical protein
MTTGFELSTKMMPFVRTSIGEIPAKYFFDVETADYYKDTQESTDLILKLSGGDVAVRVRQFKYIYHFPTLDQKPLAYDWSVRFRSRNGFRTEIDKLRDGYARWYFMGIANDDETDLYDYGLIDLDKCRVDDVFHSELWQVNPNGDGTAGGYLPMRWIEDHGYLLWHKDMQFVIDMSYPF